MSRPVLRLLGLLLLSGFLLPGTARAASPPGRTPETGKLRDITDIEQVPPQPAPNYRPLWLGLGLVLPVLLLLTGWKFGRRWRHSTLPSPQRWALAELDHLEELDLSQSVESERFPILLSEILRRYLELRSPLPASRQTTEECLQSLRASSWMPPPQQAQLQSLLERCDLAKFAGVRLSAEECRDLARAARAFLEAP
ncbi:MAG: DUF4381 family protein [Planctomycetes bacterium]|nr:DUF4381 family protein [Planctomycetota bacterium]